MMVSLEERERIYRLLADYEGMSREAADEWLGENPPRKLTNREMGEVFSVIFRCLDREAETAPRC